MLPLNLGGGAEKRKKLVFRRRDWLRLMHRGTFSLIIKLTGLVLGGHAFIERLDLPETHCTCEKMSFMLSSSLA